MKFIKINNDYVNKKYITFVQPIENGFLVYLHKSAHPDLNSIGVPNGKIAIFMKELNEGE